MSVHRGRAKGVKGVCDECAKVFWGCKECRVSVQRCVQGVQDECAKGCARSAG